MAEEFVIKLVSDDVKAGLSTSGPAGGGGGIAAGVGLGAQLAGGFAIMGQILDVIGGVVNDLLRPIKSVLKGIFKMIGEFLRPIVEIFVLLLRPVFIILQPLVLMFKTFMAPFMDIAKKYGQLAQQEAGTGNIGAAMTLSMKAFEVIIGPFIISIVSIGLQLATVLVVTAISKVVDSILFVVESAFRLLPNGIGDDIANSIGSARTALADGSDELIKSINNKIKNATSTILTEMASSLKSELNIVESELAEKYAKISNIPVDVSGETQSRLHKTWGEIGRDIALGLTNIETTTKDNFTPATGNIVSAYQKGLDVMSSATDTYVTNMIDKAKKLVSEKEELLYTPSRKATPYGANFSSKDGNAYVIG